MFDGTATQRNLAGRGFAVTVDGALGAKSFAALLARAHSPVASPPSTLMLALGVALASRLDPAGINTPLRVRHFLAQAACETWGFTLMAEKASGMVYEGRRDLGNIYPGDGARFKGRGLLDTTGRWNYQHLRDVTGLDCMKRPEVLEQPDAAVLAAVAYWRNAGANKPADANDILQVTKVVNGGTNGLADRKIYFDRLGVIAP
jgi:putative chitinase